MFAVMGLQIINYESLKSFENDPAWSKNLIEQCGEDALNGAYQDRSLKDFGLILRWWGAFYGLWFQIMYTPRILVLNQEARNDTIDYMRALFRLLVAFLFTIPWIWLGKGIKEAGCENPYVAMWIEVGIPEILKGFSWFFLVDMVSRRVGLIVVGDITEAQSQADEADNEEKKALLGGPVKTTMSADGKNALGVQW